MRSTPSLYLSHLSRYFFLATTFLLAASELTNAQACGAFVMNQQPYGGYSYVGSSINNQFTADFTLNNVKTNQVIQWYWTKNGTQIAGTGGIFTNNGAEVPFNQNSTYNLTVASATVDNSGDYQLVVQSSCNAAPCTCVATFNSTAGIMRVDPVINTQPVATAAQINNNAVFTVTANDGLGGVALVYDWFRREPYSNPTEVLVGSTSGSTSSTLTVNLNAIGKTGNYYARVRHNRGGTNPDRSVYGQQNSYDAPLALNIPNSAALSANVCRTSNWNIASALKISPENFVGGFYQVNTGGNFSIYLQSDSNRYNGLGNCYSTSQPAGSYICTDSLRPNNDDKQYIIQTAANLISTQYRYEKNAVAIAGTTNTAINPGDISYDDYYKSPALNPGDDGSYRLNILSVPCGTTPGLTNALPVDVVDASITINTQNGNVIDPVGFYSNTITPPSSFATVDRGGASFYISASHPTLGLTYQWQKFDTGSSTWVNVPNDATGSFYSGNQSYNLYFYYDDYNGDTTRGIRYSDAGQYRCKITTSDLSATVYSQTFNLSVLPQAPLSATLPDALTVTAGNPTQIYSFNLPLEAINLTYTWKMGPWNTNPSTWSTVASTAIYSLIPVQGDYGVIVTLQNTTADRVTGQPVTSPLVTSMTQTTSGPMHFTVLPPALVPPTINTPPSNQTVVDGQAAQFSVSANGSAPLNYQWQESLNGGAFTNIGGNSPFLSFVATYNASITSRRYQVIVSNGAGSVTSPTIPATLTVNAAPPVIITQPASATVSDTNFNNFIVAASGTGPFTYQWQSAPAAAPNSYTNISGATNLNYLAQGLYNINNLSRYRVIVTGPTGLNVTSNQVTPAILTVTPNAPVITTQPQSQSVPDGSNATFNVLATQGTGPFTYQWQFATAAAPNNFSDIGGATSTSLNVPAQYNVNNGYRYRAIAKGPTMLTDTSSVATLTVQPPACSAPGTPTPIAPAAGSTNVLLLPTLSWQPVTSNPLCSITYEARVSTDGTNNCQNPAVSGIAVGSSFNVSTFLQPQTTYYWCVRALANAVPGNWSNPTVFQTTTADTPAPTNPYTVPYTTPTSPAGNHQIILGAYNGEPTATGIFYLKRATGDVIVGSTLIGNQPGGKFEISIDATAFGADAGPREYYARQQRAGNTQPGAASTSVIYYFDPNLTSGLPPPVLQKNDPGTIGSLKWTPVAGATSYRVYRRVNTVTTPVPVGQPLYAGVDGRGPKPFTRLPNVTPVMSGGFLTWTDTNLTADLTAAGIGALTNDGVSYFVTAVTAANVESNRSNAQSFADTIGPVRSPNHEAGANTPYLQQVFFLGTATGRSAKGYLCNINPGGYFHGSDFRENSPDIIGLVQVKLKPAQTSCAALSYDQGAQSFNVPFDAIESVNIPGYTNCLYVGEVGNETLVPNTAYCFKTCLRDNLNNSEQNCLEGTFGQTNPDTTPPDFAGAKEVIPQEDGTSLLVKWDPPTAQQQVQEPITYIVTATNKFDAGEPVFDEDAIVREADRTATNLNLTNLDTGKTYCIRVAARDEFQNQNGNSSTKCAQTLNNIPFVDNLSIVRDTLETQKLNISFSLVDRNRDGVRLSKIAYKTADVNSWVEMASTSISGNSDFLASGDEVSTAPMHLVSVDTLPYFSGQRENFALQLTFTDIQGNSTTIETTPTTAFYSNSRTASYARFSGGGCTAVAKDVQSDAFLLIMSLLGLIGALGLRVKRYRAFTGITK